jgi:hypothetical protein
MQDAIAGFQSAPPWAQVGMVLFALLAVVMLVGPSVRRRTFRRHFDAIVRGLGQESPARGGVPAACQLTVEDRAFDIRYEIRLGGGGSTYRGPRGDLLITSTRMAGSRWAMHMIDIALLGGPLARLVSNRRATGDAAFDGRFAVVEDGLPVREGWLDAATRQEVARFFDGVPPGLIWIRDGELQYLIPNPWTGLDGPVIRALLQRQAILASALERTAGARFSPG